MILPVWRSKGEYKWGHKLTTRGWLKLFDDHDEDLMEWHTSTSPSEKKIKYFFRINIWSKNKICMFWIFLVVKITLTSGMLDPDLLTNPKLGSYSSKNPESYWEIYFFSETKSSTTSKLLYLLLVTDLVLQNLGFRFW